MSGLIYDMPSNEYHGGENTFSSSQLKTILEDSELFYRKYITKEVDKETSAAFDVGTYFHTAILEPEKLQLECAVFTGVRRGKAWDAFQEENKGKAIITETEFKTAETLIYAVKNSPVAMGFLEKTKPEVSAFVDLFVTGNEVYTVVNKKPNQLTLDGWVATKKIPENAMKITIKCRADALGDNFILDLKSTTGNAKIERGMMKSVSEYSYDLSAALYLDIFSAATGTRYDTFLWTFASKAAGNSKTYSASRESIMIGRAKWKKAVCVLSECIRKEWKFEDTLGILEPNYYEKEWIKPKEEDEL